MILNNKEVFQLKAGQLVKSGRTYLIVDVSGSSLMSVEDGLAVSRYPLCRLIKALRDSDKTIETLTWKQLRRIA